MLQNPYLLLRLAKERLKEERRVAQQYRQIRASKVERQEEEAQRQNR